MQKFCNQSCYDFSPLCVALPCLTTSGRPSPSPLELFLLENIWSAVFIPAIKSYESGLINKIVDLSNQMYRVIKDMLGQLEF